MREYWDRYIRDERHFHMAVNYIHQNPVKARLAGKAKDWPWSSAREFAELGLGDPGQPILETPSANLAFSASKSQRIGNDSA